MKNIITNVRESAFLWVGRKSVIKKTRGEQRQYPVSKDEGSSAIHSIIILHACVCMRFFPEYIPIKMKKMHKYFFLLFIS